MTPAPNSPEPYEEGDPVYHAALTLLEGLRLDPDLAASFAFAAQSELVLAKISGDKERLLRLSQLAQALAVLRAEARKGRPA